MKTQINQLILFAFFALLTITACQDETLDLNGPNEQQTIVPDSALANLMSNTTANFGAYDDILDGSSCFSIELPVTIIVSDITITIETIDDLEQLEDIFEELADDEDFLDFVFPITIIFSDYTELVIENAEQLESFINECEEDDEVIECIDFVYPISFSVFNSEFNIVDTVVIENDEALYNFLEELEGDNNALIVSLNYPVTLEYANGDMVEVSSNEALSDAILAAEEECDGEQETDCDDDAIEMALKECQWEIAAYSSAEEFQGFLIDFNSDYTFDIILDENEVLTEGNTWSVIASDNGLILVLDTNFEDLGGDWQILECDDDRFEFVKDNQNMVLEQICEDDINCSFNDISAILQECPWDFNDASGSYNNYQMIFNDGGDLQITESDTTSAIGGVWSLTSTDNGIVLTFSQLTAFQEDLGGDWLIIECDNDRIKLLRGDQYLVLEQNCYDNSVVFDCFSDFELVACLGPNNEAEFNLSAQTIGLIDCPYNYIPSFYTSIADAESNINAIVQTESYWSSAGEVYLRIEAENGNFEVFTIYLNTEDCNLFECFESFEAVIELCDVDNDSTEEFNLTIAYSNCTPSADLVTYHETEQDALNGTNAIATPESYNNYSNPQTIYVRVEIENQMEVFTIDLMLTDCNAGSCTEGDVDGILAECLWNITSFNGSDNLAVWNFDFELGNNVVIIYTDTETIDAVWTTEATNDGVVVTFSEVNGPNIQEITGSWLVVECTGEQLVLHDVNNSNNEMVLDRTCN